jgi:CheY-like chemotaxis protein
VVDDDEAVRIEAVDQLRSLGYVVMSVHDGPAGLEMLKREEPFGLMLSDVVMPWPMGGKELAAEIRKHWAGTAVIFMSGHSEGTILGHGLLEAGVCWLAKPFRKAQLARAVAQALGGGETVTESYES